MKLASVRDLASLSPVLKDFSSNNPDPVYWVFSDLEDPSTRATRSGQMWANMTIIVSGLYNNEYPKTFGHYHGVNVDETYHLIEGEGILQLQKKHLENGIWIPEIVDEVILIKAKPGDEVLITKEWGHSWSNVGKTPLITFDNWRSGHTPADYEDIKNLQGLAYYLINKGGGEVELVPNPNYKNLPEPLWMNAEEFRHKQKAS